jgi:hypothetical protein
MLVQQNQKKLVTSSLGVKLDQKQNTIGVLTNGVKVVLVLKLNTAPIHITAR